MAQEGVPAVPAGFHAVADGTWETDQSCRLQVDPATGAVIVACPAGLVEAVAQNAHAAGRAAGRAEVQAPATAPAAPEA